MTEFWLMASVVTLYLLTGDSLFRFVCTVGQHDGLSRRIYRQLDRGEGRERRAAFACWLAFLCSWPALFGAAWLVTLKEGRADR